MTGLELITLLTELGQEALDKKVVLVLAPTDDYWQALRSVYDQGTAVVLTDMEVAS